MAFDTGLTKAQILNNVQQYLVKVRDALTEAQGELYGWTAGLALADLEAIGFDPADAQSILNASADMNNLATVANGGTFGPFGANVYNFLQSSRSVIGPQ